MAASSRMGLIPSISTAARPLTSIAFSRARSRPIFQCRHRPGTTSPSTSRRQGRSALAPSDHRIRPAPLVPVENQGSYTHPTVAEVASPFLSSLSDAKSKLQPTSKIARKCTAFLRLQPLNSPTRFSEDPMNLPLQSVHRQVHLGEPDGRR